MKTIISRFSNYKITPVFTPTTELSATGKVVCKELGIREDKIAMSKDYPMIKCNVNKRGKKLFFLPFDKYYDQVHVEKCKGELYTKSIN